MRPGQQGTGPERRGAAGRGRPSGRCWGHRDHRARPDRQVRGVRGTGNREPRARRQAARTAGPPGYLPPTGGRARCPTPHRWAGHRPGGPGHPGAAGRGRQARRVPERQDPGHRGGCRTATAAAGSGRVRRHPTATSDRGHRACRDRRGPGAHSARTARTGPAGGRAPRARRTNGSRTGWAVRPAGRDHPGRHRGRRGRPDRTERPAGPGRARPARRAAGYHQAAAPA